MLCSVCNKNTAVIFINKIENGKNTVEGLCYNCAKEKGINPLEVLAKQSNLSEEELNDMSSQLENIFNDLIKKMILQIILLQNPQEHRKEKKLKLKKGLKKRKKDFLIHLVLI